jgi:hypothetical protein
MQLRKPGFKYEDRYDGDILDVNDLPDYLMLDGTYCPGEIMEKARVSIYFLPSTYPLNFYFETDVAANQFASRVLSASTKDKFIASDGEIIAYL